MTREEIRSLIRSLGADAFNPIYVHFIGVTGCREMLYELLFSSPGKRPMGLDFWLGENASMAQGVEKADGQSSPGKSRGGKCYHWWLKKWKARQERRKARRNPECNPGYGKYSGYEL